MKPLYYEITNIFQRTKLAKQLLNIKAGQSLKNSLNLPIQFYSDRQLHQQANRTIIEASCSITACLDR
ncbi:hypothetical protein [Nostoc sp. FACHB-888]|uniref:hypothetical protein n=1 Tax=Nostoc sp. FACHB-888 TaxID=2692842 RepID=UPI001F557008|nr:hypothetical protein [Nostoc sp. FACHB-888]